MNDNELQEDLLSSVRFDPYKFTMTPLKVIFGSRTFLIFLSSHSSFQFFKDPSLTPFQSEALDMIRLMRKGT